MADIRIESPNGDKGTYQSRVLIDGVEVPDVTDISVRIPLDWLTTVKVDLLASSAFVFEGRADVHVTVVVLPGYVLTEEAGAHGSKRYRAVAEGVA